MFDYVRKHNKIMQIALFLLIVPSFVLFGLEGYTRFSEKGDAVAKVGGDPITQEAWDQAHRREAESLRNSRSNIDPKLLDTPEARYATLEKMVRDRVLMLAAAQSHVTVSNQRVADELLRDEFIRSLRGPDGKLDMERYRQALAQQGVTPEQFEARLRNDLSSRQVLGAVFVSGFGGQAASQTALQAYLQRRVVAAARFEADSFKSRVQLSDAELEQYYKDHLQSYQLPERAAVEYLVLDLESVKKTLQVQESDLRAHYEQNAARLSGQEERRASHILITANKSAPAAEREKAKAKAQALQAQVAKAPQTFAEVARKESQDPGSAAQGGDLDFFGRGAMTKPFEDAVFAMKKGEVSPVVESEFGYHVITLTDIKAPKTRSFEDMSKELEADVRKQLAQKKYAEMAEAFTNGVYEQSDTYKPLAEKFKLDIRTAQGLAREPVAGASGPLASPKLLAALFSPESVEKKRNTEAIEIGQNTLVSARLTQYEPARAQAFADVKDKVRAAATQDKALALARQEGQAKLQAVKADGKALGFEAEQTLSRLETKGWPASVVQAVLGADVSKLPVYVGVDWGQSGYAVLKVSQVLSPADEAMAASAQARAQYNQWWSSAEAAAYYNTLKERMKVSVSAAKPGANPAGSPASSKP